MKVLFTKMHGLGNDFVVMDARKTPIDLTQTKIQQLSNRHYGIGFDQLLVLENKQNALSDFFYRIYNSNGDEVEQCGNGARCIARYVKEKGVTKKSDIVLETIAGMMPVLYGDSFDSIQVNLGKPEFTPNKIPFRREKAALYYTLQLMETQQQIMAVSMGNPHAVLHVSSVDNTPVETLGARIGAHPDFPHGVNVGFMEIQSPRDIRLRVFERGCGETQACGSGACAAVVSGIRRQLLDRLVNVHLLGGTLQIAWPDDKEGVMMTGPAVNVYEGFIYI